MAEGVTYRHLMDGRQLTSMGSVVSGGVQGSMVQSVATEPHES